MADIYGQDTKFGGAFKAFLAKISFSTDANGDGGLGTLAQNIRSDYTQQVSRLWELSNGQNTYYVVGRSQGNLSISRIIGPAVIATDFVTKFADACQVTQNTITIDPSPGFCTQSSDSAGAKFKRVYHNCLITTLALQMAAADMMIQEQLALMFTSLENA